MANTLAWIGFVVAIHSLQFFADAANFETVNKIKDFSSNFQKVFSNPLTDLERQWLRKAATPNYLQDFIKLVKTNSSSEISQKDFSEFIKKLLNGVTSDSCKGHVTEWFWRWGTKNIGNIGSENEKWVLHMLDAWGKLPEGILSGHVNAYGDFDECVQVKVNNLEILNDIYPEKNIAKNFDGQYCTSYILDYNTSMSLVANPPGKHIWGEEIGLHESVSLGEFLKILLTPPSGVIFMIPSVAVCLPNSCSVSDVQQILVNGMHMAYSSIPNLPIDPVYLPWPVVANCADNSQRPLDGAAIAVIILLVTLVSLALGAGILDYYYSHAPEHVVQPKATAYKYLMAFSLYTNTKKWLSTRKSPEDLGCLHGIRFFSTAWVVLAHTYAAFMQAPHWNKIDMKNIYKNWSVLAVINGTFSVDTFFTMSGMLAAYSILKMLDRTKGKFNVIMFYVHRYIRLTPTYAILVGIAATLLVYAGNGPNWYSLQVAEDNCRKNWWTNILYINNLVNAKEMCNGESWYLANDMQFYILSPLIVYPIWKWEVMGLLLLTICTILACVSQVLVVRFGTDVSPAMVITGNLGLGVTEIYNRPWSRITPFLIGIWLGWLLHKTRGKRVHLSRPQVLVGWLCCTGVAFALIFGIYPWFDPANEISTVSGYFYAGLSRGVWGIVISWVVFACVKGYGGIVNSFLSWKVFMPLGRLCFCVYLTSIHLQAIFHVGLSVPIKWDNYTVVNLFFAHMVMSYMVGFACTLLFESPFIILQKLLFDGSGGVQKRKHEKLKNSSDTSITNDNDVEKAIKINND